MSTVTKLVTAKTKNLGRKSGFIEEIISECGISWRQAACAELKKGSWGGKTLLLNWYQYSYMPFFAHGTLRRVPRSSPQGSSGLHGATNGPLRPAKSVLAMRITPLTLNFSLNLAIMRYVPARLWLRTDEMPILVQDRRGQRDPRKRPRARGAIMARPRCKPHRPFYFLWGNTASRASGPVVKVAAAS